MKTLLIINASGRVTRSRTRGLTERASERWHAHYPQGRILDRDIGLNSLPTVSEDWIAGAFTAQPERTEAMTEALRISDELVDEIAEADALVIGTPLYNFGMPAALKGYLDQIVRVGRTFAFQAEAIPPYRPLLPPKPTLVITSAGDGSMNPGGALYHLNFLEPHLQTVLAFMGLTVVDFVRVGYDEFADDRLRQSLASAQHAVDNWIARLSLPMASAS